MPDTFRFWGRQDPRGRVKPAILAASPAAPVYEAGVATIRLYDPIDSWGEFWGVSASEFLQTLDQVPGATEIRLHLNSPGGEVYEAVAILNALRQHPARVVAVVDGIAASAASFIAAGADELIMSPNTELMIHDAWGIGIGPAETMRELAGRLDALSDNIAGIYAAKAGTPVEDWRAAMLAETWYSAAEAVAVGLADSVADGAAPAELVAARFDLSVFRSQGRAGAPDPVIVPRRDPADVDPSAGESPIAAAERAARYQARRHAENARRAGVSAA